MLRVEGLSVSIGGQQILQDVSFSLEAGQVLMVVGPNGSGKTTLVRAMMGILPHGGRTLLDGEDVQHMPPAQRARRIGVLTQTNSPQFAYTVEDLVAVGRYAHRKGWLSSVPTGKDREAIDRAMELTRTQHLRSRVITTLSGGELQRACLARALAQEPDILILDEPTNHLDIEHQLLIFDIIKDWIARERRAVLSIVHDLNLALCYGTHALLLERGRVFAQGKPGEVFSGKNLADVYHVDLVEWMKSALSRWQEQEKGGNSE